MRNSSSGHDEEEDTLVLVCVNKMDLAPERLEPLTRELLQYVSTDVFPIVPIVATDPHTLGPILEFLGRRMSVSFPWRISDHSKGEHGVLLEVSGRHLLGDLFRVLVSARREYSGGR